MSGNVVFGQKPVAEGGAASTGWLYHLNKMSIGSSYQPQSILHLNNGGDPSGPLPVYMQISNTHTSYTSQSNGFLLGLDSYQNIVFNQQQNAELIFLTNNLERLRISSAGLVGIGTNNPTEELHLVGSIRMEDGLQSNNKIMLSDANGVASWQDLTITLSANQLSIFNSNTVDLSPYLDNTDNQDLQLSGNILSLTNDATNVDLSAYVPLTEIEVDNFVSNNGYLITEVDGDITNEIQQLTVSNSNLLLSNGGGSLSLDNLNYWQKDNDNLYYNVGKIGIGIATPENSLHVHSDESIPGGGGGGTGTIGGTNAPIPGKGNNSKGFGNASTSLNSIAYNAIQITNSETGTTANDGFLAGVKNNNAFFELKEEASIYFKIKSKNVLKINKTGQISISDPQSPDAKLNLQTKNNTNGVLIKNINNTNGYAFKTICSDATNGQNYFVIKGDGNVGIGTVNPTEKLDVNGKVVIRNGWRGLQFNNNDTRIHFIVPNSNESSSSGFKGFGIYDDNAPSNGYRFVINNSGNVGIGTTNPHGFKLAVKGGILAEDVIIRVNADWNFPDYVFEPDYKLISLEDLKEYIKENKHLPGIPSNKEVHKDGMNVKEMNKLLLEKVEELTLYILEQDERIKKLENEIKNKN